MTGKHEFSPTENVTSHVNGGHFHFVRGTVSVSSSDRVFWLSEDSSLHWTVQ